MSKTASTMPELGKKAAEFSLIDCCSNNYDLNSIAQGKAFLVMFICNHCPFVLHIAHEFDNIATKLKQMNINTVAINSNDSQQYPEDDFSKMKAFKQKYKFSFPYLHDESQEIAKKYMAACTPDFSLFDKDKKLYYRGQMDESRPGNNKETDAKELLAAAQRLHDSLPSPQIQKPSLGCNIKWKPELAPDYFLKS